ncbi:MAG TPA: YsnF/AvaK domain-containing protein [Flavisolibacter sp.]|jgi:uncharacterized protein (TIGR02271 family)|nr:YsnF/AvaK domain-containing protein [Flavisolibacter sp.]
MNIQQYFEEKEQKEQEKAEQHNAVQQNNEPSKRVSASPTAQADEAVVIPVIQESATVHKEVVESAKVQVHTHVTEETKSLAVPLATESYEVKRVPINELINERPPVRQEGNCTIIPVVEEVLVVEKRLKLVEEVHVVKRQVTNTHKENITLRKEEVVINRIPTDKGTDNKI